MHLEFNKINKIKAIFGSNVDFEGLNMSNMSMNCHCTKK